MIMISWHAELLASYTHAPHGTPSETEFQLETLIFLSERLFPLVWFSPASTPHDVFEFRVKWYKTRTSEASEASLKTPILSSVFSQFQLISEFLSVTRPVPPVSTSDWRAAKILFWNIQVFPNLLQRRQCANLSPIEDIPEAKRASLPLAVYRRAVSTDWRCRWTQ